MYPSQQRLAQKRAENLARKARGGQARGDDAEDFYGCAGVGEVGHPGGGVSSIPKSIWWR